jgi:type IV secretory pathway VirD2 relaxase
VLRTAQRRSGRAFRLDVRQRVIVKALVSRHAAGGRARGAALLKHASYLGRSGAGMDGGRPEFFDRDTEGLDAAGIVRSWTDDRHHFRFIISPEHGDRIEDFPGYVREVMRRVGDDLGQPHLAWIATAHFDTDQPHAHVLVRGRRSDGRDLVIPRDYIGYGLRARAQEVAQERLGELSRHEAERRIWRETEADRFTGFDRRLMAARAEDGTVSDGAGRGPWAALLRGRLRRLEALGLAARVGGRYRIVEDLEAQLRGLQGRNDIIRTMNQRRLVAGSIVRLLGEGSLQGRVIQAGHHDELGAQPYLLVRDRTGVEHYARLSPGTQTPKVGQEIVVQSTPRGAELVRSLQAGVDFGRP